jgi:hypothetical protein
LVGRPEDLYFEAKTCSTPFSNDDKDNFAKALSGFANADGGVLVWGLQASGGDRTKPDVVTGVKPVSKLSAAHSELLSLVGQVVEPLVENVQVLAPCSAMRRSASYWSTSRAPIRFFTAHGETASFTEDMGTVSSKWSTMTLLNSMDVEKTPH